MRSSEVTQLMVLVYLSKLAHEWALTTCPSANQMHGSCLLSCLIDHDIFGS
ncbi:hypothetical protein BT93_A1849 [Corymbia citriodora subsp. variegata]|nr:hypothetical protein BT93_A1849 [Corymbia citriodora subsp. variegata]